jgi:hypothetical protein
MTRSAESQIFTCSSQFQIFVVTMSRNILSQEKSEERILLDNRIRSIYFCPFHPIGPLLIFAVNGCRTLLWIRYAYLSL